MSGDWIKMRCELQTHPKIVRILSATKADKFRVVGGLHAVWSVFDQHSVDGVLFGYTPETLDHIVGWDGFAGAMIKVGWLAFDGAETLTLPEFDEHNGQSAKRRAEDQKRKRNGRKDDKDPDVVRTECGQNADKKRTREEKRREYKNIRTSRFDAQAHLVSFGVPAELAKDWLAVRKAKRLAPTATAFDDAKAEADKAGIPMADAIRMCCVRGWGGFKASWLTEQDGRMNGHGNSPNAFE